MSRWLKLLLISVVALALPMQGVAAAAKLMCGQGGGLHSAVMAQADEHAHHQHGSSHSQEHKCSACATCCSFVALPSAALLPLAADLVNAYALAPPAPLDSATLKGPQRPPCLLTL